MLPYPSRIVDPEYSADDVLFQISGDKLHLDGSVAVDSVFWPVLWAQLNQIGMCTYTHTHTHIQRNACTPARRQINKGKHKKRKDDLLVSDPNYTD